MWRATSPLTGLKTPPQTAALARGLVWTRDTVNDTIYLRGSAGFATPKTRGSNPVSDSVTNEWRSSELIGCALVGNYVKSDGLVFGTDKIQRGGVRTKPGVWLFGGPPAKALDADH